MVHLSRGQCDIRNIILATVTILLLTIETTTSFTTTTTTRRTQNNPAFTTLDMSTTTTAPPETDRRTKPLTTESEIDYESDHEALIRDSRKDGPLEYLEDDLEHRNDEDPYHILLLGSTFEKPRISIPYVSGSLVYVLDMPEDEAMDSSKAAKEIGMSCLGTWSREECLSLGRELQVRDLVCRVVPFCEGGQRGWQARDATGGRSSGSREYSGSGSGSFLS